MWFAFQWRKRPLHCETSTVAVDSHDIEAPGLLTWLQGWYTSMCDGDWEHGNGVTIETIDNPGWRLRVQVSDTGLETKSFDRIRVERDEHVTGSVPGWRTATSRPPVVR